MTWALALISAVTASIAVWIAYAQWRTARQKLAIDLFERRYEVYSALNNAIFDRQQEIEDGAALPGNDLPKSSALAIWHNRVYEAEFLFGPEVTDHLSVIRDGLETLAGARRKLARLDTLAQSAEFGTATSRVQDAQDKLLELVKPYMLLGHLSSSGTSLTGGRAKL